MYDSVYKIIGSRRAFSAKYGYSSASFNPNVSVKHAFSVNIDSRDLSLARDQKGVFVTLKCET